IWSGRGSGRPGRRGRTTLVAAVVARSDGTWTARPGGAVRGVSMSAGRIIAVVVGALLALFGLGAGAAAGGLVVAHTTARDSDGCYTTGVERFETSTVALVGSAELREGGPLGEVRVRVTGADRGPVFVGIGPRDQVEDWLAGTAYERLLSVPYGPFRAETELVAGDPVIDPPAEQDF